jgi:hypothetical protein
MPKFLAYFTTVFFGAVLFASSAWAFGPDDIADVEIAPFALGPGWKQVPNVYTDSDTTVRYERKTEIVPKAPPPPKTSLASSVSSLTVSKKSAQQAPAGPQVIRIESVTKSLIAKPEAIETNVLIGKIGTSFTQGFLRKGCESGPPIPVPQKTDMFRAWLQVFQCQKTKGTGLQFYIDADPTSIYLVTYTDTHYPFTIESRDAAEATIKNAITVCYQSGKNCLQLQ